MPLQTCDPWSTRGLSTQLLPLQLVLSAMATTNQRPSMPARHDERRPQEVPRPTLQDGVRNALRGSFTAVPALPDEFVRLLDRLR